MPGLRDAVLSVHCHDDLGLAVANSFAGVLAGARQVECAINGIGERAGNASLEEIVMLLHTRQADVGLSTGVVTREIARSSRLVSRLTGYPVQPNKAIVGRNAFAHESGIHQDGMLKERSTYEIMDATTVGLDANQLVLGKHSGRHALRAALEELGYQVDGQVAQHRLQALQGAGGQEEAGHRDGPRGARHRRAARGARRLHAASGSTSRPPRAARRTPPSACARPTGDEVQGSFTGDGPIDAVFRAINAATGLDARLREFRVDAVTGGQDALGEVSVVVELGANAGERVGLPGVLLRERATGAGQAVTTDIIEAAGIAYARALTNAVRRIQDEAAEDVEPTPELATP